MTHCRAMHRLLAAVGTLALLGGCNCGRQAVTTAEATLSLPSDLVDFGVVPEGTTKTVRFRVENTGRVPVDLRVALADGGSPDFTFGALPANVQASSAAEIAVVFAPMGAGADEAVAVVTAAGQEDEPLQVTLRGGPIAPALAFAPDPLDFAPSTLAVERRTVQVQSTGTAALTVSGLAVADGGNPDFAVVPVALPARVLPGASLPVTVEYTRSARFADGLLRVTSDAADAGVAGLRLLADPLPACATGATRACQGDGGCAGTSTCANGTWGACGCDAPCDPTGVFTLDAGVVRYQCCNFGVGPQVKIDIGSFAFQSSSTVVRPQPSQPGGTLSGSATTCPGGAFSYTRVISGSCTETYALTGTFVGPDTFVGTYRVTFTGADCTGSFCASDPCSDQSWSVSAGR